MTFTKLKHRIGSTLRIGSFVLCILLSLLWVRSCTTSDLITLTTANHYYELATIPASICLARSQPLNPPASLSWTAVSSQPWVKVSPTSGSSGASVSVSLDQTQLDTLDPGARGRAPHAHCLPPGRMRFSAGTASFLFIPRFFEYFAHAALKFAE